MIILILCFAALAAAKSPSISLQNNLEPPLEYIPVNREDDVPSSKIPSFSKPPQADSSAFAGDKYILPNCPNGKPPPCTCPPPLVGTPPNCRGSKYLPILRPKVPQCPRGEDGTPPNCRKRVISPIRCPPGWLGDFYPNCTYKACPAGQVGIYPDCRVPPDVPYCYKERKLGTWPDCYDPCPAYQMGRPDKEPFCRPIPCPTGKGWVGDFQPNCVYTPMCPENAPGVWPDCQELYCTANFQGEYPDCVCPAPFVLKSTDVCAVPPGYNPLNE